MKVLVFDLVADLVLIGVSRWVCDAPVWWCLIAGTALCAWDVLRFFSERKGVQ